MADNIDAILTFDPAQIGELVETLSAEDLAAARMTHPCTRRLYEASAGYSRKLARESAEPVEE